MSLFLRIIKMQRPSCPLLPTHPKRITFQFMQCLSSTVPKVQTIYSNISIMSKLGATFYEPLPAPAHTHTHIYKRLTTDAAIAKSFEKVELLEIQKKQKKENNRLRLFMMDDKIG